MIYFFYFLNWFLNFNLLWWFHFNRWLIFNLNLKSCWICSCVFFTPLTLLILQVFIGIAAKITNPVIFFIHSYYFFLYLLFQIKFISIAFTTSFFYINIVIVTFFTLPHLWWLIITSKQVFTFTQSIFDNKLNEIFVTASTFFTKLYFVIRTAFRTQPISFTGLFIFFYVSLHIKNIVVLWQFYLDKYCLKRNP